jgi:hypothetical protein
MPLAGLREFCLTPLAPGAFYSTQRIPQWGHHAAEVLSQFRCSYRKIPDKSTRIVRPALPASGIFHWYKSDSSTKKAPPHSISLAKPPAEVRLNARRYRESPDATPISAVNGGAQRALASLMGRLSPARLPLAPRLHRFLVAPNGAIRRPEDDREVGPCRFWQLLRAERRKSETVSQSART